MKRQLCKKSGQKDSIIIDLVIVWSGQQQVSSRTHIPAIQPNHSERICPLRAAFPLLPALHRLEWSCGLAELHCYCSTTLQWTKICYFGCTFSSCRRKPTWGLSIYMLCPNERVQQTPEFMLCKKEAKSVLAAFGGPSIAGHSSALLSC